MKRNKRSTIKSTENNHILRNIARNKSGELLVEALAAFVILLIVFVGITVIVLNSTNMNKKADINSKELDKAVTAIETSGAGTDQGSGNMILTFSGSGLTPKAVSQEIMIKEQDEITFFVPVAH